MPTEARTAELSDVRVVSTYSTSWRYLGDEGRDLANDRDDLDLDELTRHYELYRNQLPRLLPSGLLGDLDGIELRRSVDGIEITKARALLFALPSNQVVLAVILAFRTRPLVDEAAVEPIAKVLELAIDSDFTVKPPQGRKDQPDRRPALLPEYIAALKHDHLEWDGRIARRTDDALLPERHLLVFVSRRDETERVPSRAVVRRIVYRESPPYREEFGLPKRPGQLNLRRDTEAAASDTRCAFRQDADDSDLATLGVVTPYVSLLYGHERYVEDSIFLSTVHAVGTATVFRQIWHEAYHRVRQFREKKQQQQTGLQTRGDLEELADRLGNLEFDLTFSVEFPLMRIETFQTALYDAMDLSTQANALSQMFEQLDGSLRSEITAIDVRERRRDERRQKWNAFAAGILSMIGVSVGFVIAFLGVNTTEVPDGAAKRSMWDPRFAPLYLIAALFALTPTFLIAFPYLRDWAERRAARDRKNTRADGAKVGGGAKTGDGRKSARDRWKAAGERWTAARERRRERRDRRRGAGRADRRALWCGLLVTVIGGMGTALTIADDRPTTGRWLIVDDILVAVAVFTTLVGISLIGLWAWATRQENKKRDAERDEERRAAEEERRAAGADPRSARETRPEAGRDASAAGEDRRSAEEETANA